MSERKKGRVTRRDFLKAAGAASLLAGCSPAPKPQKLIPYLVPPENIVPGVPLFYRTVCRECPAGCGVTARTREGRAIKLEGNPDDPIGRGALCALGQATLQRLYAPERPRGPLRRAAGGSFASATWDEGIGALVTALGAARAKGPGRIRMLTRAEPGTAGAVQRAFMAAVGASVEQRVVYDPFDGQPLRGAGDLLFGRPELPAFDLGGARSVVSFGADFVGSWLSPVELARGLAAGRGRIGDERTRLTWIGPRLSLTGANADLWLPARAGSEGVVALGLLRWLCDPAHGVADPDPQAGALLGLLPAVEFAEAERRAGLEPGAIAKLGAELARRRPSAILGPGPASGGAATPGLAVAILLLNQVLGNVGKTVRYGLDPLLDPPAPFVAVRGLLADMSAGRVDVLLVHHADPMGTLPAACGAAAALDRVPLVVSLSDRMDDTTARAHLILPDHHTLESWGDLAPRRGVTLLAQPVMTPLWDTRAASQTLLDVTAKLPNPAGPAPGSDFPALVRAGIDKLSPGLSGDALAAAQFQALQTGGAFAEAPPAAVSLRLPPAAALAEIVAPEAASAGARGSATAAAEPPALLCYPTAARGDGRGRGLPWLEELADPLTTISWSSWVEVSPARAARLGIRDGDVLALATTAGRAELPAYVYPGVRDDAVAVPLGGPEPLALLADPGDRGPTWLADRVEVTATGRRAVLARLEGSSSQQGRRIIPTVSAASPVVARPATEGGMYPPPRHPEHRWAMAIDLDRCTGCQACVVACYAENNLPVNGPELLARGRSMEWLRVERYFDATPAGLRVDWMLMLCQHCTSAPCEPVCPVYATYHTPEGLNAQVYNRCVGTRYCSNNCPYKVRVFNWRDPVFAEPLDLQLNPDVTVRSKGVMEKCTFCVHRIRAVEIAAETEKRPIVDGEVTTACAQTCPTGAIVFGDLNDPRSRVAALTRDGRAFRVLEELNTGPAVTYLARVREA